MNARRSKSHRWPVVSGLLTLGLLFLGSADWVSAEKLPIKTYTIADGLALDEVTAIRQDSRHLLWFITSEGVSWFDGYEFTTYTTKDGLPHSSVNEFLQTRSGDYWLATDDGLCRFIHDPRQVKGGLFEVFRPDVTVRISNIVYRIVEDPDGSIWCGTARGLFHFINLNGKWTFQPEAAGQPVGDHVHDLVFDKTGTLWIASDGGVFCRRPDGRLLCHWPRRDQPGGYFRCLEVDRQDRLWVGTFDGLYHLTVNSQPGFPPASQRFTVADGLPHNNIVCLLVTAGDQIWAGTPQGLAVLENQTLDGPMKFRAYTVINGLSGQGINALGEDDDGNLWVGAEHSGVMKISRTGFSTFDEADGLAGKRVESAFTDQAGNIGFLIWPTPVVFTVTDGRWFTTVPLPGTENLGWVGWQSVLQDHNGEWWLATGTHGLWRYSKSASFAALAGHKPVKRYTSRNGLPTDTVFSVFEDSRGDIWLGLTDTKHGLVRWDRRHDRFVFMDTSSSDFPIFFAEDRSGSLWIGFYALGLWRYRQGRITSFTPADGLPAGCILHIFQDRQGRLWISSIRGGAACIPDPSADHPQFIHYTTSNGLSSNHVRFVMEDRQGRLHFGTSRGVDQLDPVTGTFKHFTIADGLAANYQDVALSDRGGSIWFGTFDGISSLTPGAPRPRHPPAVWIRKLRIGGAPYPLDELGQSTVPEVIVPPERNRIEIEFTGSSFASGDVLTYRYRLGGADAQWRTLPQRRTLELVDVRPGTYRFAVQAINSDGLASPQPAVITFTVLAPLWQRWWFIALVLLAAGGVVHLVVRFRIQRRMVMERMRTRIATDLHDDIGSSLSQIAILSEVADRNIPADTKTAKETLASIAATSRELVESMSDIVWAINPRREKLSDLVHRMRRFAIDLFSEGGITHTFQATGTKDDIQLDAELRRETYLVFKECLHNVVRHSQATAATSELRLEGGFLQLEVSDNGRGFDPKETSRHGHGLKSIWERAQKLGGRLKIDSRPGSGTRVLFQAPLPGTFRLKRHWISRRRHQRDGKT